MAIPLRKPKEGKVAGETGRYQHEKKVYGKSVYGLQGTHALRFGQVQPTKGKDNEGNQLVSWDALPDCYEQCPITDKCPYNGRTIKCTVMKAYLGSAASIVLRNYQLDEAELLRVGTHLIPLYRNLCRLQILEFSLTRVTQLNKVGNVVMHPVYDMIKNHVVVIENLWKSLGLHDESKKKKHVIRNGPNGVPDSIPTVGDIVNGDPDYYDNLRD